VELLTPGVRDLTPTQPLQRRSGINREPIIREINYHPQPAAVVAAALIVELQASGQFVLAGVGTFSLCEAKGVPTTHAGASAQKTVQFEACSSVLHQV
jgi:hypothetical protein